MLCPKCCPPGYLDPDGNWVAWYGRPSLLITYRDLEDPTKIIRKCHDCGYVYFIGENPKLLQKIERLQKIQQLSGQQTKLKHQSKALERSISLKHERGLKNAIHQIGLTYVPLEFYRSSGDQRRLRSLQRKIKANAKILKELQENK